MNNIYILVFVVVVWWFWRRNTKKEKYTKGGVSILGSVGLRSVLGGRRAGYRYDPEILELSGGMAAHSTFPWDTTYPYINYPYIVYYWPYHYFGYPRYHHLSPTFGYRRSFPHIPLNPSL